ncbi:MAG: HrpE/YscL family type III secretion apparatus protein [Bacteroidales bacterium]
MDNIKLGQLIDTLVSEGVQKGDQQASQILEDAGKKAESIVNEAQAKADGIIADAKKQSELLKSNTQSELQLSTQQLISSIKQEIVEVLSKKLIDTPVSEALKDTDYVKSLMEKALVSFGKDGTASLYTSDAEKDSIAKHFAEKTTANLKAGLEVKSANKLKAGFQVGPADGSYKVSFADEDFEKLFRSFLRPKLENLLFDK